MAITNGAETEDGDEEASKDETAKMEKDEVDPEDDEDADAADEEAADREMLVVNESKHHVVPSGSVVIHDDSNGVDDHDVMNGDTEKESQDESNHEEHEQLV